MKRNAEIEQKEQSVSNLKCQKSAYTEWIVVHECVSVAAFPDALKVARLIPPL